MKQQIIEISEKLQKDCHNEIKGIIERNKEISYQDATNVWLFIKLAEMELRIQELEKSNTVFK